MPRIYNLDGSIAPYNIVVPPLNHYIILTKELVIYHPT